MPESVWKIPYARPDSSALKEAGVSPLLAELLAARGVTDPDEASALLDTGWHSLMSNGHLTENDAAQSVTSNPARVFGFPDRGELLPTRRADFAVFETGTNRVLMTVKNGQIIYRADTPAKEK